MGRGVAGRHTKVRCVHCEPLQVMDAYNPNEPLELGARDCCRQRGGI
jgi:hypothetical protein